MNRMISTTAVALVFILALPIIANAAEIKIWTARALATVLAEVGPQFERTTGHHLSVYSGLPADFARRANAGETFDVLVSGAGPGRWFDQGRQDRRGDAYRYRALGYRRGNARGRAQA